MTQSKVSNEVPVDLLVHIDLIEDLLTSGAALSQLHYVDLTEVSVVVV